MRYLLLGFIFFLAGNIYSQWVTVSNGINPNQRISSIAAKGSDIFAVTSNFGVCLTTNNGNLWRGRNSNLDFVPKVILNCGPYVFVGFNDGTVLVDRSSDTGVSWEPASNGLSMTILYQLYAKGEILFAGGFGGEGLYRSTNYGNNWTGISNGINFQALSVIFSNYNYLFVYAGTGLYRSTNNGDNWVQVNNGLNYAEVYSMASSRSYLLAGTNNGVYLSTNNGDNWNQVNNGLNNLSIYTMAATRNQVYAVNDRGIFLTTNYGLNWVNKNNNIADTNIISLCINGENVFAGTNGSGIFLSTNNGGSWSPINNGIVCQDVNALASNSTRMFAGVWRVGLYYSTNDGVLWNKSNFMPQTINALKTKDSIVYACVDNGFYRSTNNGVDFFPSGLANWVVSDISECNNYLFATVSGKGVYRSTDSGLNWATVNSGITTLRVNKLITVGSSIYVGADSGNVFVSTNSGTNWIARNSGLPIKYVYVFTYNGNYLFAATAVGVYRSANGGISWTLSNSGLPANFTSYITSRGANIFASAVDGIYLSTNNGDNWNKIDGISPYLYAKSILLTDNYLFAGINSHGISKRLLSEIIGIQNISTEIPSKYSLGQNYPNPFNPMCNVQFTMCNAGQVKLIVYDIMGREVRTLVNEKLSAGTYEVKFDGSGLTSGVYFYRMVVRNGGSSTEGFTETKRMLMIK